jgi:hypothetical protein
MPIEQTLMLLYLSLVKEVLRGILRFEHGAREIYR